MRRWVHRLINSPKRGESVFDPPPPPPIPGKGFPAYFVEFDGFVFRFSSLDELDVCINVLGQKNLPNVEAEWRGQSGPGSHWLNKLPGRVLPWSYREPAVKYVRESRDEFAAIRPTWRRDQKLSDE